MSNALANLSGVERRLGQKDKAIVHLKQTIEAAEKHTPAVAENYRRQLSEMEKRWLPNLRN